MREGVEGWLFPAKEIGDWANWKGLELPGEEKGRGLPAGRRPTGAGLSGGERGWGTGAQGRGQVCRPTELEPQRYRVGEPGPGGGDGAGRF